MNHIQRLRNHVQRLRNHIESLIGKTKNENEFEVKFCEWLDFNEFYPSSYFIQKLEQFYVTTVDTLESRALYLFVNFKQKLHRSKFDHKHGGDWIQVFCGFLQTVNGIVDKLQHILNEAKGVFHSIPIDSDKHLFHSRQWEERTLFLSILSKNRWSMTFLLLTQINEKVEQA